MVNPDIILDIINRTNTALEAAGQKLDEAMAKKIEMDARLYWGGARLTINKRTNRELRNSRIVRAYLDNKRLDEIARQENVTTRRISQIIKR